MLMLIKPSLCIFFFFEAQPGFYQGCEELSSFSPPPKKLIYFSWARHPADTLWQNKNLQVAHYVLVTIYTGVTWRMNWSISNVFCSVHAGMFTRLSTPRHSSMMKNRGVHNRETGIVERASGYTTKTRPGPEPGQAHPPWKMSARN